MIVAILGVGYLGSQIASYLECEGITPLLVTRDVEKATLWQNNGAHVFLLRPFLKSSWETLVNLCDALIITVAPSAGASYEETYLTTAQFLSKVRSPKPLFYCSSTSVYGEKGGDIVDENTPLSPLTSSSYILAETEKVYLRGDHTVVRIGELWGKGRRIEERLMKNGVLGGDGSMLTNLTEAQDAARAFIFLLKGNYRGIFNACGNLHIPRKQFYEGLARLYRFPTPFWDRAKSTNHSGNKIVSSEKIKNLGFTFHFDSYV